MTAKKETKVNIETEKEDKISQKADLGKEKKAEAEEKAEEEKAAVDPMKEMEAKLKSAEQEAKENYDRFLRVSAEFENYKKRSAREMADFKKFANESLIKELLSVVDNLERAINSSANDEYVNSSVVEGVNMTLKEILKIFEKYSVKPIESLGKTFDPNFHQAISQEETEEHPENTVLKEFNKGYLMHDRLIRPSIVIVSKTKVKTGNDDNNDDKK